MSNKFSQYTVELISQSQAKIDKKIVGVDKKIASLRTDMKAAKSAKLSASALKALDNDLRDAQSFAKHLAAHGVGDILAQEIEKQTRNTARSCTVVLTTIDGLIAKGLNTTVRNSLDQLVKDFDQYRKTERNRVEQLKKSSVKPTLLERAIVLETLVQQSAFFEQIAQQVASVKVAAKDKIGASNQFPLRADRKRLAPLCVKTARRELKDGLRFTTDEDKMDMLAMFVSDARNHFELGVQLLDGNPKKIENARDMDTASRDGIDENVWEFASEVIYDTEVFGPKALKLHRQKVERQEVKKLNNRITKAIGDTSALPRSTARKM